MIVVIRIQHQKVFYTLPQIKKFKKKNRQNIIQADIPSGYDKMERKQAWIVGRKNERKEKNVLGDVCIM